MAWFFSFSKPVRVKTLFLKAARSCNWDKMAVLLSEHPALYQHWKPWDALERRYLTPLCFTTRVGLPKLTYALAKAGAPIQETDQHGNTLLHHMALRVGRDDEFLGQAHAQCTKALAFSHHLPIHQVLTTLHAQLGYGSTTQAQIQSVNRLMHTYVDSKEGSPTNSIFSGFYGLHRPLGPLSDQLINRANNQGYTPLALAAKCARNAHTHNQRLAARTFEAYALTLASLGASPMVGDIGKRACDYLEPAVFSRILALSDEQNLHHQLLSPLGQKLSSTHAQANASKLHLSAQHDTIDANTEGSRVDSHVKRL